MENLESKIESLLFISGRPMSVRELSELIKAGSGEVEAACEIIMKNKKESNSGLRIIKI
jgi:chromosome segregation and condensation protein ScpB